MRNMGAPRAKPDVPGKQNRQTWQGIQWPGKHGCIHPGKYDLSQNTHWEGTAFLTR